ncbi:MAG: SRPBCC family protein [Verrucomicrobiota bacterium]
MKFGRILVRWLLIVFVVLVTAVAVGGFFLPSRMEVSEERVISSPAPELYDRLASLKRWPEWAPWWKKDPFLQTEFAGPDSGAGAAMQWLSKSEGTGQAKITAVIPNRELAVALDFADRGEGECLIQLEESADQKQTRVRWSFSMSFGLNTGRRYFGLFFRNSLKKDLAEALERLETAAHSNPAAKPAP